MPGQRRIQDSVPTMQTRSAWTTIRLDCPLLSLSIASSAAASQLVPCARLRGSTALAARSVDQRFTVDSRSEVARGRRAPAMQGPNEKAARVLDIYGAEGAWGPQGIESSRALNQSSFARIFRRKTKSERHHKMDTDHEADLLEHIMKATAALEGLTSQSQTLATLDIYRMNDPNALTSDLTTRLEELTANMEKKQSTLLPAIARVYQILRDADQVLRDADEQIRLHKAITAPWRRLPHEILAEIFLFAASPTTHLDIRYHFHPLRQRCYVAAVCRVWRSVALDTAQLWSYLYSTDGVSALECQLWRTKQSPLNVDLHPREDWDASTLLAWDLLRRESHRWRTLFIDRTNNVGGLPDSVSCAALETLRARLDQIVTADDSNQPPSEVLLFSHLRDAVNLRRVDLDIRSHDRVPIRFPECWRLSCLSLDMMHCDEAAILVKKPLEQVAPTLEVLRIITFECEIVLPPSLNPIPYHFPRLRELHLVDEACEFIAFIEAPVLAFMRLQDCFMSLTLDSSIFLQALDNVSRSEVLSKLDFDDILPSPAVFETLRKLPQLEWLRMVTDDAEWETDAIDLFVGLTRGGVSVDGVDTPPNALCPLPNLRYLSVCFELSYEDAGEIAASLRRLALSRHPSVSDQEDEEGVSLRPLDVFYADVYTYPDNIALDVIPTWGKFPRAKVFYARAFRLTRTSASISSTDGDASESNAKDPRVGDLEESRADEGDICKLALVTDALKVEKKLVVECELEQQHARPKEQQEVLLKEQKWYVSEPSDSESDTAGSHTDDGTTAFVNNTLAFLSSDTSVIA
ncbi:hypothetical protein EV121DRAFT_294935 [Schizophyllum commune]